MSVCDVFVLYIAASRAIQRVLQREQKTGPGGVGILGVSECGCVAVLLVWTSRLHRTTAQPRSSAPTTAQEHAGHHHACPEQSQHGTHARPPSPPQGAPDLFLQKIAIGGGRSADCSFVLHKLAPRHRLNIATAATARLAAATTNAVAASTSPARRPSPCGTDTDSASRAPGRGS